MNEITIQVTKSTKRNAYVKIEARSSQRRRYVEVFPHLQRRPSQRAALHTDQLDALHALLRAQAGGGRVVLSGRIQIVFHVAPVDDADRSVVVARLLAARPELAARFGVRRCARGDRRCRQDTDRSGWREHLAEGTSQVPHRQNLSPAHALALNRRVLARRGDVSRRRLRRVS